ncbi:hypothetical protein [Autumnicola musiva]|uniref:Uncharacterized protein n=1 Tax=Autumnicola musiva TaxID=3075589 RepID=A0ABU3DAL5_9FLAO|nr:hypothetical protein [Zunongwangia sp. F117]MDT0678516.1 hypothetical protein [Zunongwangia sp. F117]
MKHLFKTLSLSNFNEQDILETLNEEMNKSDVSLTFRWTKNRQILFYKLHLKYNEKITDLLNGASLNNSSGAYTFHIGNFQENTEIEVSFGVFAIVSIPKLIVILSQTNPTIGFQASPKDTGKTNKLDSGSRLEETIKHKIQ